MKHSAALFCAAILAAAFLPVVSRSAEPGVDADSYRMMIPVISVKVGSVSAISSALSDGLGGIGYSFSAENVRQIIAEAFLLPDIDCLDKSKPASLYFLSNPAGEEQPECAVILPLSRSGKVELLESMVSKYSVVNGKSIRVCREPLDSSVPDVVYFAVVDGNALLSTSLNGVRWLAFNLRDKSLPSVDLPGNAPLKIVINGPLAAKSLKLYAESFTNNASAKITLDNVHGNLTELSSFLENFSSLSFSIKSNLDNFEVTMRLNYPRYSEFDSAMRRLNVPDEKLVSVIPAFAENQSVSSVAGFVAALPKRNRYWLSALALDTRFTGFAVFPAMPDLDDKIYPLLTGSSVSMFVADKPTLKLGSVTVFELANAAKCSSLLQNYFAKNEPFSKNTQVKFAGIRNVNSVPVYRYDVLTSVGENESPASSSAGDTLSVAAELNRVEAAVSDGKLIIADGRPDLIDLWLGGTMYASSTKAFAYRPLFSDISGTDSVALGGGCVKPIETLHRLFAYIDNFGNLADMLPHSGNGFYWNLSRCGSSVQIELYLSNNELLACRALADVKSAVMEKLFSKFMIKSWNRNTSDFLDRGRQSGQNIQNDAATRKDDRK